MKPGSEELPTDLKVLVLGVRQLAAPREMQGDVRYLDEAATWREVWDYAGDSEESRWLSEQDKKRTITFVEQAAAEIARGRLPSCRWWQPARPGVCRR